MPADRPNPVHDPVDSSGALYDIGAVARLTGLSSANLRIWEKRYGVTEPSRSESGRRQYSEEDVRQLTLLKHLADLGHPIRTTSKFSIEQLEEALVKAKLAEAAAAEKLNDRPLRSNVCRVVIVGDRLSVLFSGAANCLNETRILATFSNLEAAEVGTLSAEADLLIVEIPAFFSEMIDRVQRLIDRMRAVRAIVVYSFAQEGTVRLIHEGINRITAIRAPISLEELRVACAADIALANRAAREALFNAPEIREKAEDIPERQFNDGQLARIAQMSSAIECECPHHLAGLLTSLIGFEKYSAECENRNAADAEMHVYLHKTTAHARAIIEDALQVLVEFEGIDPE